MNPRAARLHPTHVGWLLVALALVTAPHVERLPWWVTLLLATLLGWRAYITWHGMPLPPKWLLFAIAGGAVGGIYIQYGRLFGRDSGVTLLVIMLTLKLLEMAALRDAMVLVFLCYFLVITNFLYSQTIPTALYLLLVVWVITACLIGFQFRQQQPGWRYQFRSVRHAPAAIGAADAGAVHAVPAGARAAVGAAAGCIFRHHRPVGQNVARAASAS